MTSTLDELRSAPSSEEEATARGLLRAYRALRRKLFLHLAPRHPDDPRDDVLSAAQTLVDRLLAIALAEERGLLPGGDPFGRSVFPPRDLDRFTPSPAAAAALARLARRAVRGAGSIELLGHVFERSVGDLETLRSKPFSRASRRHDQGIHYTPPRVARFLVEQTLGRLFAERAPAGEGASIEAWRSYRQELRGLRVLDPACGAGAFLVAAHGALAREHRRVDAALAALGAAPHDDDDPIDPGESLHGVDLCPEAVELARLSLWLQGASRYPDGAVRCGDGLADDRRGFDVVIGNPPYVRHELLAPIKARLEASYAAYHGMADLFVYFFERGLAALAPGGRLGFVVSNKWLRAEYGAPLRRMLAAEARLEAIVDLGHAPVFRGADTSPCLVTLQRPRPGESPADHAVHITSLPAGPRRFDVPQRLLGEAPWSLDPPKARALLEKIRRAGTPLLDYVGSRPFYGIKTGLNEAFLVDSATRERLLASDPGAAPILRRYLRGQDIARWAPVWSGQWIVLLASSGDRRWPWTGLDEARAEEAFARAYPALHAHMKPFEEALRRRADRGHSWWELRACAYYEAFARPKIVYQEIQFHPAYALDTDGLLLNNKGFFLASDDPWLLAVLNSPLVWWYNWRSLPHMKDETLSPTSAKMERLPIAPPSEEARAEAASIALRLARIAAGSDEARDLERRIAARVNEAYGLSPAEVDLLWSTAPPRMPGTGR